MASPVFAKMIADKKEIELPGKKLEDIVELLKAIYPNFPKTFEGSFFHFYILKNHK
jgi:hypothetical protein